MLAEIPHLRGHLSNGIYIQICHGLVCLNISGDTEMAIGLKLKIEYQKVHIYLSIQSTR